jgi:hypothetical protein
MVNLAPIQGIWSNKDLNWAIVELAADTKQVAFRTMCNSKKFETSSLGRTINAYTFALK